MTQGLRWHWKVSKRARGSIDRPTEIWQSDGRSLVNKQVSKAETKQWSPSSVLASVGQAQVLGVVDRTAWLQDRFWRRERT